MKLEHSGFISSSEHTKMRKKLEPAPTPTPTTRSLNSKSSTLNNSLKTVYVNLRKFSFLASSIEANGERLYNGEVRSSEREGWATLAYLSVTWADSGGAIEAWCSQRHNVFPYQVAKGSDRGLELQTFYLGIIFNSDRFDSFDKIC